MEMFGDSEIDVCLFSVFTIFIFLCGFPVYLQIKWPCGKLCVRRKLDIEKKKKS